MAFEVIFVFESKQETEKDRMKHKSSSRQEQGSRSDDLRTLISGDCFTNQTYIPNKGERFLLFNILPFQLKSVFTKMY